MSKNIYIKNFTYLTLNWFLKIIITIIIKSGADICVNTIQQWTPLHWLLSVPEDIYTFVQCSFKIFFMWHASCLRAWAFRVKKIMIQDETDAGYTLQDNRADFFTGPTANQDTSWVSWPAIRGQRSCVVCLLSSSSVWGFEESCNVCRPGQKGGTTTSAPRTAPHATVSRGRRF